MKTNKKRTAPPISDAEEAAIQAGIAEDPDNPEWTEEDFKNARPFPEVFPQLATKLAEERRRRQSSPKKPVSVKLDPDVVDKFRATGPGWQGRMNAALRKAVGLK